MNIFNTSSKDDNYEIMQNIDNIANTIIYKNYIDDNPLSNQGIKINSKTYRLLFFEKSITNLTYEFEKNTLMKIYFDNDIIILKISCPKLKLNIIKKWIKPASRLSDWKDEYKELNYINMIV